MVSKYENISMDDERVDFLGPPHRSTLAAMEVFVSYFSVCFRNYSCLALGFSVLTDSDLLE